MAENVAPSIGAPVADTVGGWLSSLQPPPPPALAERLSAALAPFAGQAAASVPEACMEAGERMLEALLASGSTSRGTALDLLAVDALITYAFQAASETPSRLEERAARAMVRIAELAGERPK